MTMAYRPAPPQVKREFLVGYHLEGDIGGYQAVNPRTFSKRDLRGIHKVRTHRGGGGPKAYVVREVA